MKRTQVKAVAYAVLELDGVRYAVVRESLFKALCQRAGAEVRPGGQPVPQRDELAEMEQLDAELLAERLIERRKAAGLSQARLAREAGIRVETLNRIERGKVTPDFSTIRKLVTAIKQAEVNL